MTDTCGNTKEDLEIMCGGGHDKETSGKTKQRAGGDVKEDMARRPVGRLKKTWRWCVEENLRRPV